MLLWHFHYFELQALELQALEILQMQEGPLTSPVFLKAGHKFSVRKMSSCTRKRRSPYHQRLGIDAEMDVYKQTY